MNGGLRSVLACALMLCPLAVAQEPVDLNMYSRIRDEGFNHSHVMEYAAALTDDIGPRLTGSSAMAAANEWTRMQLADMGCSNARLESWGEFGMAWTQLGASLSLVSPGSGVFLAQATPWSPSTKGPVTADLVYVGGIENESELSALKGKLRGKVILYGRAPLSPDVNPDEVPKMEHADAATLAAYIQYPINAGPEQAADYRGIFEAKTVQEKVAKFFAAEGVIAVLEPGGAGGILFDDSNASMGWFVYKADRKQGIPEQIIETEAWDRLRRLVDHKGPVKVRVNIETQFGDEHANGYNTVAEIAGTDPKLKDEVVMVGGHLDSWTAGTGATDNAAGAVVAMEAMRILSSLKVKPRRTIRIALWSGEEQGLLGSFSYVNNHFAELHHSNEAADQNVPISFREMAAKPMMKPEAEKLDAYYNLDNGTGKIVGIYTNGNVADAAVFAQWIKPLEDLGISVISNRSGAASDVVPFQQAGLPGFMFIQDWRDYNSRTHHTNLDTYEHLSARDLKQAAVVEAVFLYNTAMRDEMLPRLH